VHGEPGSLHRELRRIGFEAKQRSAPESPPKEEMDSGARASYGELDFQRGDGAAAGLERRAQVRAVTT